MFILSQIHGSQVGKVPNYSNLCSNDAQSIVDNLKKSIKKYFEDVCLSYLQDSVVMKKFESKLSALQRAWRSDTITKDQENKFLDNLRVQFNPMIDNVITQGLNSGSKLTALNNSIVNIFEKSDLFKFYDSANWIEKLREKVKKIYE